MASCYEVKRPNWFIWKFFTEAVDMWNYRSKLIVICTALKIKFPIKDFLVNVAKCAGWTGVYVWSISVFRTFLFPDSLFLVKS